MCCVIFLARWPLTERFFQFLASPHSFQSLVNAVCCGSCVTPSFIMLFLLKVKAHYQECSSGLKKTQTQTASFIMLGLLANIASSLSSWSPLDFQPANLSWRDVGLHDSLRTQVLSLRLFWFESEHEAGKKSNAVFVWDTKRVYLLRGLSAKRDTS